jgi:hypothetical protein
MFGWDGLCMHKDEYSIRTFLGFQFMGFHDYRDKDDLHVCTDYVYGFSVHVWR